MIYLALLLIAIAAGAVILGIHFLRAPDRDGYTITGAIVVFGCAANALWPAAAILAFAV